MVGGIGPLEILQHRNQRNTQEGAEWPCALPPAFVGDCKPMQGMFGPASLRP